MRRICTLTAAVVLAVTLHACESSPDAAGGDGSKPQVATLTSAGATPSPEPEARRPRERLDMTAEDEEVLWAPYHRCLKEHGYTQADAKMAGFHGGEPVAGLDAGKVKKLKACVDRFLPLPPWELDPANPAAADFDHAVTRCLQKKGFDMADDSTGNVAEVLDATSDCRLSVAKDQK
ncbi:hypothetical protein [Jidongwangia harbinensis]|uniref:hypothetical protein n=1 Tax=Jidongwangia harbinensis TaxID=2878561 RepID=UPI001CD9AF11|nr:hypothetical protein [Jidongwangia harbinensis]MCA2215939.1 hypothetical protein [Jidongwangia harbinensis]